MAERTPDEEALAPFALDRPEADETWLGIARRALAEPADEDRLGGYTILARVGCGAQGTVYRARQPLTERVVAIKRLSAPFLRGDRALERFRREIRVLTRLAHPCIVTVHAAELVEGEPVLVMEWVDGETIDRWARSGAGRSRRAIAAAVLSVCEAVAHAHRQGVLHCDLKPGNVLVDRSDRPRVLDFGLARFLQQEALEQRAGEPATGFVGTPAFASPEQLEGQRLDTRSDVYSLGALLSTLFVGAPPRELESRPVPDPSAAGASRRAAAGPELDSVIAKAMADTPSQRYPSAEELGADLRRWLAGEAVEAHPGGPGYRLGKLVRRHKLLATLALGALGLVLAFAVSVSVLALRLDRRRLELQEALGRETAALAAERAALESVEREARRHGAVAGLLEALLAEVGAVRGRGDSIGVAELLESTVARLDRGLLGEQPDVDSSLRVSIGSAFRALALYEAAERQFRRAVELGELVQETNPRPLARALDFLTALLDSAGRYAEAEDVGRRGLALCERTLGAVEPVTLSTMVELASALDSQGRHAEALALYQRCLASALREEPPRRTRLVALHRNVGLQLLELGRLDEAEASTREALRLVELWAPASVGQDQLLSARRNLARILFATGRRPEALALLRSVREALVQAYGGEHPDVARESARLAAMIAEEADLEEARALYERAQVVLDERLGTTHPSSIRVRLSFARALAARGELAAAEDRMRRALEDAREAPPGAEALVQETATALAELLLADGRLDAARAVLEQAGERLESHPPRGEILPALCSRDLALLLARCAESGSGG